MPGFMDDQILSTSNTGGGLAPGESGGSGFGLSPEALSALSGMRQTGEAPVNVPGMPENQGGAVDQHGEQAARAYREAVNQGIEGNQQQADEVARQAALRVIEEAKVKAQGAGADGKKMETSLNKYKEEIQELGLINTTSIGFARYLVEKYEKKEELEQKNNGAFGVVPGAKEEKVVAAE
jgi:hypothetical protein